LISENEEPEEEEGCAYLCVVWLALIGLLMDGRRSYLERVSTN
jgi:hypothetical protein